MIIKQIELSSDRIRFLKTKGYEYDNSYGYYEQGDYSEQY